MAEAPEPKAVVEEFLARQREMYAGGDLAAVEELLAEDRLARARDQPDRRRLP